MTKQVWLQSASVKIFFLLNIENDIAKCLKTYYEDITGLWNMIFGYINFQGLKFSIQKRMVKGLPSTTHRCGHFVQHASWFRKGFPRDATTKARKPLKLPLECLFTLMCVDESMCISSARTDIFSPLLMIFTEKHWSFSLKYKSLKFNCFQKSSRCLLLSKVVIHKSLEIGRQIHVKRLEWILQRK